MIDDGDSCRSLGLRDFRFRGFRFRGFRFRGFRFRLFLARVGRYRERTVFERFGATDQLLERIMVEADRHGQPLAGILILGEKQAAWAERIRPRPNMALLIDPGVTMKTLKRKLEELLPG